MSPPPLSCEVKKKNKSTSTVACNPRRHFLEPVRQDFLTEVTESGRKRSAVNLHLSSPPPPPRPVACALVLGITIWLKTRFRAPGICFSFPQGRRPA